ncbi:hypothetical protein ONE63_009545 [Megalurothrips usitatus]|uniref:Uncharacterized protein n=1 Tax=Megalurothrips usitatus TaxID=439358 RepID=A0AAV7XNK2_9NEOP|nr:hypothetical protein ONE63_009545 [Megalurothrips usitatus]
MMKSLTVVAMAMVAMTCLPAASGVAPELPAGRGPLLLPGCQPLASSPNGYVAVARTSAGLPPLPEGAGPVSRRPQPRAACSSADNTSCYWQCRNSGYNNGWCCCSCGSVSLCQCTL